MKTKNILFSLLAVLSTVIGTNVKAATTAPSSFTINSKDLYSIDGSKYLKNSTISLDYKKNTNSKIVYCTESTDSSVHSGSQTYTLSKELGASYAYIIENGYPYKKIFDGGQKDYFTTALAMWYLINPADDQLEYFNLSAGTYRGGSSDVVKAMNTLVTGAKKYSYTTPTIKLNSSNNNLSLSSDGKYYVSSNIGVKTTGTVGNYTVSLENAPKGTIITDKNGSEKKTFSTGDTFLVKVPKASIDKLSTSFNVKVSADGSINKAYLYKPAESKYQNVAAIYPENISVNDNLTLKLNLTTKTVISKVDVTDGSELPGATLVIKDSNNKVVEEWVSTDKPHVIENLPVGKYTLTEKIAPEGYVLSEETITFEVKADGSTTNVKMTNAPKAPNVVYISKQDVTTGNELPGAKLELKDSTGEVIAAWVSTDEPHKIEGLKPGKYTLTEVLAPEGYELSKETVEFTVKEDGTVDGKVIMYNKPETIIKVPSTGSFKTIWTSLIGLIIMGLGSVVIYKNYKKNEEI